MKRKNDSLNDGVEYLFYGRRLEGGKRFVHLSYEIPCIGVSETFTAEIPDTFFSLAWFEFLDDLGETHLIDSDMTDSEGDFYHVSVKIEHLTESSFRIRFLDSKHRLGFSDVFPCLNILGMFHNYFGLDTDDTCSKLYTQ